MEKITNFLQRIKSTISVNLEVMGIIISAIILYYKDMYGKNRNKRHVLNKKNKKEEKNQNKAECGELGRSCDNDSKGLRTRDPEWLSDDTDFEDGIDDISQHPNNRPKPHNTQYIDDEFDY